MKFSTEGLAKAGLDLVPPFFVEIDLDPELDDARNELVLPDSVLNFKRVLRVLPGRRVSGEAELQSNRGSRPVFAKIFYGPGARRYWQRELVGAIRLERAEITSARVVGRGATSDGGGFVVLYEVLPHAVNLSRRRQHVNAAVVVLAELHNRRLMQSDVHLDNFVLSGDQVYAVDADGIRRAHLLRQHFTNLATFLGQLPPTEDANIDATWDLYAEARGEYVTRMGSGRQLLQLTRTQRALRVRKYLQKTQRSCSEFVRRRSWRRNCLCDRNHWQRLQRFMVMPETYMGDGTPLKLGGSATVVRIEIDGERYVVKRYNIKGVGHRVRRWFRRRARNAWVNGHWLSFLEIPTARPVALLEQKWGWFRGVCYLVMPDCGSGSLSEALAEGGKDQFSRWAPQTIAILKALQTAGLQHGDLKATNFVIEENQLVLIDYDALGRGPNQADIERFRRNWEEQPELDRAWGILLEEAGL